MGYVMDEITESIASGYDVPSEEAYVAELALPC